MTAVSQEKTPGSPVRTLLLAGTLLCFAAVTFDRGLGVGSLAYYPRFLLAGLLLFVTLQQGATTRRLNHAPPAARVLMRSVWGLLLVAALSTFWSVDPGETALQAVVFALLVATMQTHIVRRWYHRDAIVHDMRTIYWVLAPLVLVSLVTGTRSGDRLSGIFENANMLGLVAAMTAALGMFLLRQRRSGLITLVTLTCGVAVLLAQSRTALVALIVVLLWFALRRRTLHPIMFVATTFGGAAVTLALLLNVSMPLPEVVERFTSQDTPDQFLSSRPDGWRLTLSLWEQRPLTGYGFRVGETVFAQNYGIFTGFTASVAANSYLQTLLEVGIVGTAFLGLVVLALARAIWVGRRDPFVTGIAPLVIVGLLMAVTESALLGVGQVVSWVFWLGAAALCAASPRPALEAWTSAGEAICRRAGPRRGRTRPPGRRYEVSAGPAPRTRVRYQPD